MTKSAPTTELSVRHFRNLFYGVLVLFFATELVALSGLVPHLRPVRFGELSANILFAIGFGCPLVLYLSSLARLREILRTLGAAIALSLLLLGLWAVGQDNGSSLWTIPPAVLGAHVITGLGLASLATLGRRAWRSAGPARKAALLYLLPALASLVFTLEVGIFFQLNSSIFPNTYDSYAYVADGGHGLQLSFAIGRLFATLPGLAFVCFAIYVAPPPGLVFVYALQTRSRRPPPVDVVTVLLFLGLAGYSLYFLCPVSGPRFAFGAAFPWMPPPWQDYVGRRIAVPFRLPDGTAVPRDGIPSLHLASVILAYWHARPYGRWARTAAGVFVIGTFLATLGLGEHYLVDLVVAFPFTLTVHAACTPSQPAIRRERWTALLGGGGLLLAWYGFLRFGTALLTLSPVLTWAVTLGTVVAVVWFERQLARATAASPEGRADTVVAAVAPGPRGHVLLGNLQAFRRDVLILLVEGREQFGDVVRFRLGPMIVHLVSHPDHIKHVLVSNQHNYDKSTRSSSKIRSVTGAGLLTSSGDSWLRQRRLVQPVFHPQRIAAFTEIMTQTTASLLERWRLYTQQGKPVDVASEMMRLTYTIVGTSLFGADVAADLGAVEQAAAVILAHTYHRLERIVDIPISFPTPGNLRFRKALRTMDEIVHRLIDERQRAGSGPADLLTLLLQERDEEAGQRLSRLQARNEAVTLLLAGHETTANALTWTWYLLAQHPAAAQRARAEIDAVLGGRIPTWQDLSGLAYTTRLIQESLRLYPPIWIMERRALADDEIAGYHIPRGSSVVVSPYVTHRHTSFWDKPEEFDPDRFLPDMSAGRPHYAYIPFGGGQRLCIGNHFAMTEALVILAMVLPRYRLELVGGRRVMPKPGITLRVLGGLPVILHPADKKL